jgi:Ca2+-binding EF-hand superfamily protein
MSLKKIFAISILLTSTVFADENEDRKSQMKKAFEESFTTADKEKNGSLNLTEFKEFHAEMQKKREESKPSDEEIFREIDNDSNGSITKDEIKNHWKNRKEGDKHGKKDRKDKK